MLTKSQIEQFHRDGILVVRSMYDPDEMHDISLWTDEVASAPEISGHYLMYFETSQQDDSRILSRIENFVPYHAGFAELITRLRMREAVGELFGEAAVLFKDKINFKLPGTDGFREHQDVQAGWDRYAGIHITAMVAIDATTAANGSLEMIPGVHRQGLLGEMWAPLTNADTGELAYEAVHCQSGNAMFFDSYVPHRSLPNTTDQARRVLYITFNKASEGDSREGYYADKRKTTHRISTGIQMATTHSRHEHG